MDVKSGLLLLTILTTVSGQCTINRESNCIRNIKCNTSLDDLNLIESEDEQKYCTSEDKLTITLDIQNVNLDSSNLAKLDSLTEKVLQGITRLTIQHGQLQDVPGVLKKMTALINLDLSNNKITKFDINQVPYTVLEKITITNNEIIEMVTCTGMSVSVKDMNLSHNKVKIIPDKYFEKFKLASLDLSHNQLQSVNIHEIKTKKLKIKNNEITDLIGTDDTVTDHLTFIDLSENKMQSIPVSYFKKFSLLEELDLSGNNIETFDVTNVFSENLQKINLSNNKIKKLSKTGGTYKSGKLTSIDLSKNHLNDIPNYLFDEFPGLQDLSLSYNSIKKIDNEVFRMVQSLKKLTLSHNELADIEHSFTSLHKLESLYLDHNHIKSIHNPFSNMLELQILNLNSNQLTNNDMGAFLPLKHLKILDLSENLLTQVTKKSFIENNELIDLNLSKNKIHVFEPEAFKGKNIRKIGFGGNSLNGVLKNSMFEGLFPDELDFSHGNISEIGPSCFSAMSTLKKLRLNHNSIHKIDKIAFEGNNALVELDISNNKLKELNLKLDALVLLSKFNVSHNDIQEFEAEVFQNLIKLEDLDLSNNQIKMIKTNLFQNLSDLKILDLHKNPIQHLEPNCFKSLQNLKKLYIQETYLTSLGDGLFSGTKNLEYLNASSCKITTIKTNAFTDCKGVKELYLNDNQILNISGVLDNLVDLQTLNLSHNDIKIIDATTFHELTKLKTIDLSFNEDLELRSALTNLKSLEKLNLRKTRAISFKDNESSTLKELDLTFCGIKDIKPLHLNNFKNLKILNLCNNQISSIGVESFKNLTSLEKLDLCNNEIKDIEPKSLQNLDVLEGLDLSGNKLSGLSYGILSHLKNLQLLNLRNNSLKTFPPGDLPNINSNFSLILDDNSIDELDFRGFLEKNITNLSIGGNLIQCEAFRNAIMFLKNSSEKLNVTAVKLVTNNANDIKNVEGITCESTLSDKPDVQTEAIPKIDTLDDKTRVTTERGEVNTGAVENTSIGTPNDKTETIANGGEPDNRPYEDSIKIILEKILQILHENERIHNDLSFVPNKTEEVLKNELDEFNISFAKIKEPEFSKIITILEKLEHKLSNIKLIKTDTVQDYKNISDSMSDLKEKLKTLESNSVSRTQTTNTLGYISAFGVITLVAIFVVKGVLKYRKSM